METSFHFGVDQPPDGYREIIRNEFRKLSEQHFIRLFVVENTQHVKPNKACAI